MSCSVHDVANLEEGGIPTVFVATRPFETARTAQAEALGTNPRVVWLAHPIQDRTDEELRQLAADSIDALVAELTS